MSTNEEHRSTLVDDTIALLEVKPEVPDAAACLKPLLDRFTTTSYTGPTEEALRELGTAVGRQSRYVQCRRGIADRV
jgi:hypothetical protein